MSSLSDAAKGPSDCLSVAPPASWRPATGRSRPLVGPRDNQKLFPEPILGYPITGSKLAVSDQINVENASYQTLRNLLVEARRTARLTQADLALRLKRPQSFVSKYERGERRLDLVEFGEVARAMEVDPTKFLAKFYRELQECKSFTSKP